MLTFARLYQDSFMVGWIRPYCPTDRALPPDDHHRHALGMEIAACRATHILPGYAAHPPIFQAFPPVDVFPSANRPQHLLDGS